MRIRAVIFDVYHTLLEVGPPPSDAARRWKKLLQDQFGGGASGDHSRPGLEEFGAKCDMAIAAEHGVARAAGIDCPEIYWPRIACEVLPELQKMPAFELDALLYAHATLLRTTRPMPGACETLSALHADHIRLGIASNAQPYTLHELDAALAQGGLSRGIFTPQICFWSFDNGFSKPDPRVFRTLSARLAAFGVQPGEILMAGDRWDNDIAPAQAQGWQTWHVQPAKDPASCSQSGDLAQLHAWLMQGEEG